MDEAKAIEQVLGNPAVLRGLDLEVFNSDIFIQNARDLTLREKLTWKKDFLKERKTLKNVIQSNYRMQ